MRSFRCLLPLWIALIILPSLLTAQQTTEGYHEFNYGNNKGGEEWIQAIKVSEPAPRSEIKGDVTIKFQAPGMKHARAMCWQQPTDENQSTWGHDQLLTPDGITLDAKGHGAFVFPAEQFPHGPINVRIFAQNDQPEKDIYELQLFNLGGVKWNQGIPKNDPAAAKGLQLIFADDFDGPLSISNDGRNARYNAHKPRSGDFSGWQFSDVLGEGKPFAQTGTWLKIAARKDDVSPKGRSGILASVNMNGEGVWVKAPAYLECRFTAQSAPGTWPAFWTLTSIDNGTPGDELDIIEAYGGMGKGNPNHPGYSIVSHAWKQQNPDGSVKKAKSTVVPIMELGGKSYWSTTFHTYAVYIGVEETVYYFDDIEVFRHASNKLSSEKPHCFLINYAIGGISRWPIDLERYGNGSDMWVDYVRVYAKEPIDYKIPPPEHESAMPATEGIKAIGLNFAVADHNETQLAADEVAGYKESRQASWNNLNGANGEATKLKDNKGKELTDVRARWSVPTGNNNDWRSKSGRSWGFEKGNLKLQTGYIQHGGELNVQGIPYARYDVHVYLNADVNAGTGSVSIISSSGDVDPKKTYFYKLGWLDGLFVEATAVDENQAKDSNMVIFHGNTARDFILQWNGHLSGGWTGVSAVQIVSSE